MKMKSLKNGLVLGVALLFSPLALVAQAQPDLNELPKGDNPAPHVRPNRAEQQLKLADQAVRSMLVQGGVNDVATQDAVLSYMKEDTQARRPMRELGAKLFQAMRAEGVTDEQMLALVADYRAAQQAEEGRREEAQEALDAKIHYSENPRLEAILLLAGLIGDGDPFMKARAGGANPANGADAQQRQENRKKMMELYDKNINGQLEPDERKLMRQDRKAQRQQAQQAVQPVIAPLPAPEPQAGLAVINDLNG